MKYETVDNNLNLRAVVVALAWANYEVLGGAWLVNVWV